jgi:hypothetical protein
VPAGRLQLWHDVVTNEQYFGLLAIDPLPTAPRRPSTAAPARRLPGRSRRGPTRHTFTWPSGSPGARPAASQSGWTPSPLSPGGLHRGQLTAGPATRSSSTSPGGPGRPGYGTGSTRTRRTTPRYPRAPARPRLAGWPWNWSPTGRRCSRRPPARGDRVRQRRPAPLRLLEPVPARLRQPGPVAPGRAGADGADSVGHGRGKRPVLASGAAPAR